MGEFLEIIKWHDVLRDDYDFLESNHIPNDDANILAVDVNGFYRIVQFHYVYHIDEEGTDFVNNVFVESNSGIIVDVVAWTYVLGPIF